MSTWRTARERFDQDEDAIAHLSKAGNRNKTLIKTGFSFVYGNQPEWIQREIDEGRKKECHNYTSLGAVRIVGPRAV